MKKLFTLISIALIGLAGCTQEEDAGYTDYVQDLIIKFENAGQPVTRAEEVAKGNTDHATFSSGYIFFLTGMESVKKCYRIAPSGTASDPANNIISIDDFWSSASSSTGYVFQNVSGEVKKVYIIGNLPDAGNTTEAIVRSKTTLTELKKIAVPIAAQSNIDDVTMDGIDESLEAIDGDQTKKKASITLTPLCSRIEIAKLTSGGAVTAYKLQGIYVSHFYNEMPLNEISNSAKQELYALNNGTDYTAHSYMCDQATDATVGLGSQTGKVTTPATTGNVWAYQFLPGSDASRIAPRIVVKLDGVASTIGSFNPTQSYYLNIRGFKAPSAGDVDPMKLQRGKVYKILNIAFDESDISDIPNPADISLTVTVSIENWVPEIVEPVM